MYFYITEQAGTIRSEQLTQIKRELLIAGVSGEIIAIHPRRSAAHLVELAISKHYATIVTIGSIGLYTKVSSLLAGSDLVLGMIPTEQPTAELPDIVPPTTKQAIQMLRRRYVEALPTLRCSEITTPLPLRCTITPEAIIEIRSSQISCTLGEGELLLNPSTDCGITINHGPAPKRRSLFSSQKLDVREQTILAAHRINLATTLPLPLTIDSYPVAALPCEVSTGQPLRTILRGGQATI